jgi:hypothetical protein
MSRKRPIPGVDEAALAALAVQFPSGSLPPVTPVKHRTAALVQDNVPPAQTGKKLGAKKFNNQETKVLKETKTSEAAPSAAPAPPPRKPAGRGLAVCAMIVALLAVLIAASSVMPPQARLWLTRNLGDMELVNLVTGGRADIDRRLQAASQSVDAMATRETEMAARLEAVEAIVGSGAATRRLEAVEAGLKAADQRLAAAQDANRVTEQAAVARAEALDVRLAAFDGELKTVQDKLAEAQQNVSDILSSRLGAVEANLGELQKIDRRPEKFFLAALQLRDLTRTAKPFTREVAAVQALAVSNVDLQAAFKVLAAEADHGVATVGELQHDFTTLVAPRLTAVAAANRQSVAGQAWGWVQSQFTVGAAGAGDRNAAVAALAARSLDQGQLDAAVHQLLLLEDEAALVAAEWLKNASVRLATDKAIATIMSQALDRLAASN